MVAVKPIEFVIKSPTPYINLTTPVLYKLNAYKIIHENQYISKFENRLSKLRRGAEDELTQIDSTLVEKDNINRKVENSHEEVASSGEKSNLNKSAVSASTSSKQKTLEEANSKDVVKKIIDLIPSKQLSTPSEYSSMHIFVI